MIYAHCFLGREQPGLGGSRTSELREDGPWYERVFLALAFSAVADGARVTAT